MQLKIFKTRVILFIILMAAGSHPVFASSLDNVKVKVIVTDITPALVNVCNTHEWFPEPWGVITTLGYVNYLGRRTLRASFQLDGSNTGYIRTDDFFAPEDWSSVAEIKMDVYLPNGKSQELHLELKNINGETIRRPSDTRIGSGDWITFVWTLAPPLSENVAKILIISMELEDGDIIYFSNMRIKRSTGEEMWDTFKAPTYKWVGSEDFVPWTGGKNELISHNAYDLTHNNSAGALYIPWDAGRHDKPYAKAEATNLHIFNFTQFNRYQARVYSDNTDIKIYMAFWNADGNPGETWIETSRKDVLKNTWEVKTWDKPTGNFDWGSLDNFMFLVDTSDGGTGKVYIDDIEFIE